MSRFQTLLDTQLNIATPKVRDYLESCRGFALELIDGLAKYLECPFECVTWRTNLPASQFMPIASIKREAQPDENGNLDLLLKVWFGPGNGSVQIRILIKKMDNHFEVEHGDKKRFRISKDNFQKDTLAFYEFVFRDTLEFLENILERSFGGQKRAIGFEYSAPETISE